MSEVAAIPAYLEETIERMRDAVEQHRDSELARARKRLARGDDPVVVMEALSLGLVAKLLHRPMRALNGAGPGREALTQAVASLFLETPERNRDTQPVRS